MIFLFADAIYTVNYDREGSIFAIQSNKYEDIAVVSDHIGTPLVLFKDYNLIKSLR